MTDYPFYEDVADAKLFSYTQIDKNYLRNLPEEESIKNVQDLIAFCAKVSNPAKQYDLETADRLINYLITHKHWSPLEMADITLEIDTTRDIGRQILRHVTFRWQEFCVSGDTQITLETPSYVESGKRKHSYKRSIKQLYDLQSKNRLPKYARIYDETSGVFTSAAIKEVFYTGKKPMYKVTLDNGKSITCTKEHKVLTKDGFRTLEDALGIVLSKNGIATMTTPDGYIACNGVPLHQSKEWLYNTKKHNINGDYYAWRNKSKGNSLTIKWAKAIKIEYIGIDDTYDMEIDHDSHNYVANGIVTHNSQRYAEVGKDDNGRGMQFVLREARLQDDKNRQNSIDINGDEGEKLKAAWYLKQSQIIHEANLAYKWALDNDIAKECARVVLPEGLTMSRMYMKGSIRSWVHYVDLRSGNGTQKEHMLIARICAEAISKVFPMVDDFVSQ